MSTVQDKVREALRPRPYLVDAPVHKTQTVEMDGDIKYIFRHDFAALNAGNIEALLQREKDTTRVKEKLAKGKTRDRYDEHKADSQFYKVLIQSGGWRPASLMPYESDEFIPGEHRGLYAKNELTNIWEPGWYELTREDMGRFLVERQKNAVDNFLQCKGEYVPTATGIAFMYEAGGLMRVRLLVGDPEAPGYKLLFDLRRPDSTRRSNFRQEFAYIIDDTKAEGGKSETKINLEQGIKIFDEFFATCIDDDAHSQVVFTDKRTREERGLEPVAVSAVPPAEGEVEEEEFVVRPYEDALRSQFLAQFNPMYKVEVAAAMITSFSKTDRE